MKRLLFLLLCAALLTGCTIRQTPAAAPAEEPVRLTETAPVPETPAPTPEPTPAPLPEYTVRFYDGDAVLSEQTVTQGSLPEVPAPTGTAPMLGWVTMSGESADPAASPVAGETFYFTVRGPALRQGATFMTAEAGLFRPEDPLTRRECAELLCALLPEPPAVPEGVFAESLLEAPAAALDNTGLNYNTLAWESAHSPSAETNPRSDSLARLSACISAGLLTPGTEEDPYLSETPVDRDTLLALLTPYTNTALAGTLPLSEQPTRLECARLVCTLTGADYAAEYAFADLEPGSEAALLASLACGESPAGDGMTLLSCGRLYYLQNGRVLRDADVGTLHFGSDGAYTSGDGQLDALCRDAVIRTVNLNDENERRLRSVYIYVRDRFAYLRRNYYDTGEHGWETEEAVNMLSTHYGNCYSFCAAFRELARAVGYDAHAISGMQGPNFAPHGWVWIDLPDGIRYFFDVEAEYAALRDGFSLNPMFKMPWESAAYQWQYNFNWTIEGFPPG